MRITNKVLRSQESQSHITVSELFPPPPFLGGWVGGGGGGGGGVFLLFTVCLYVWVPKCQIAHYNLIPCSWRTSLQVWRGLVKMKLNEWMKEAVTMTQPQRECSQQRWGVCVCVCPNIPRQFCWRCHQDPCQNACFPGQLFLTLWQPLGCPGRSWSDPLSCPAIP